MPNAEKDLWYNASQNAGEAQKAFKHHRKGQGTGKKVFIWYETDINGRQRAWINVSFSEDTNDAAFLTNKAL